MYVAWEKGGFHACRFVIDANVGFFSGKSDSADSQRRAEKVAWEAQQEEDMKEELQRRNRGEEMKRKRSEEARQLIQHKTSQDARAVFEQHTAYGQMNRQSSTSKSEGRED